MKLYAVRIFVRQWAEACAFYGAALGLKERYRNDETGWAEYELESPPAGPCLGVNALSKATAKGVPKRTASCKSARRMVELDPHS